VLSRPIRETPVDKRAHKLDGPGRNQLTELTTARSVCKVYRSLYP